jgi:hypothetical protein
VSAPQPRRRPIDLDAFCDLWQGAKNSEGYGYLEIDGRRVYAHRVSYQLHVGPIPRGWQVDHLCRKRACIEPGHLETVTNRENTLRGNHPLVVLRRQAHCRRGHDQRVSANVYTRPDGRRRCRPCSRMTQQERRQADRARSDS